MMQLIKGLIALAMLTMLLAMPAIASAQLAPCVQSGGYTRTISGSSVGGTFVPTQTQVSDTFYSYPGVSTFGPYPGAGYASTYGVGFTPCGYAPFGGFTYL